MRVAKSKKGPKPLDTVKLGVQLKEKNCDCCGHKFTPRNWADRHQEVCYTCLLDGLGGNN